MKKKILFYIGFSKTGTTFIKKNILKKTKAYKYIEFNKYLTDEIFYDRDKLNKFLKSKKFHKFSKEIFKLKKNIILHKNITNPIRFIKYKKKLSYDLIFQNIKFFFAKLKVNIEIFITTRNYKNLIKSYYKEFFDYFYINFKIKNFEQFQTSKDIKKINKFFNFTKLKKALIKYFKNNFYILKYEDYFEKKKKSFFVKKIKIYDYNTLNINLDKKIKNTDKKIFSVKSNDIFSRFLYRVLKKL